MKRVPYGVRKGILLLMLRDEELKLDEFYSKTYFVTGHMRIRTLNSYLKVMKELDCGRDGTVKLNLDQCPVWLQYALYIKRNGTVTTTEIAHVFGHTQSKVHNEIHRYAELFNLGKVKNNNTYGLKLGGVTNKEADKL